jgi:hypothetical protein
MSPLVMQPKRRAGFSASSCAMRFKLRPRLRPSLNSPDTRYSVPPNPDFAMKISRGRAPSTFIS